MPTSAPAIVPANWVSAKIVIERTYGTLIIPRTVRIDQLGCCRRKTSAIYKASKAARPNLIPERTLRSPKTSCSGHCLNFLAENWAKVLRTGYFAWASTLVILGPLSFQWASSFAGQGMFYRDKSLLRRFEALAHGHHGRVNGLTDP